MTEWVTFFSNDNVRTVAPLLIFTEIQTVTKKIVMSHYLERIHYISPLNVRERCELTEILEENL